MQSSTKAILNNFSLIILKNKGLLDSIRDYFYQNLIHDFDEDKIFVCDIDNINQQLEYLETKYAIVIQEGIFFFAHIDNNFLKSMIDDIPNYALIGHILDRKERYYHLHPQHFIINVDQWVQVGKPDFNSKSHNNLTNIVRAEENWHHDYTPLWVKADHTRPPLAVDRLKFGGHVISELLKKDYKIRPFNGDERNIKKFVYYDIPEQISSMLSYEKLHPHSYYYPMSTSPRKSQFAKKHSNYISVANGVESLKKILNVYEDIKTITFYDVSITALIFTELLIKTYEGNYKEFVQTFDQKYNGRIWTTLDLQDGNYDILDNYNTSDVLKVIKHIRENVEVKYCIGDITRTSILEDIDQNTLINLSNVFEYEHNLIRNSEWSYWLNKVKDHTFDIEALR